MDDRTELAALRIAANKLLQACEVVPEGSLSAQFVRDAFKDSLPEAAQSLQAAPEVGEWKVPEAELLSLVAGPYMYHHKMDDAAMREAAAFDRCRELTMQNIRIWCATRRAMLSTASPAPAGG